MHSFFSAHLVLLLLLLFNLKTITVSFVMYIILKQNIKPHLECYNRTAIDIYLRITNELIHYI